MRLLVRSNLINIFLTSTLLLIGGGVLYWLVTSTINTEITEKLMVNKDRIAEQLKNGRSVESLSPIIEIDTIKEMPSELVSVRDVKIFDPVEEDVELFREVTGYEKIGDKSYRIIVRQTILEPHDYFNNIGLGLFLIWIFLLIGFLLIHWILSKRTWNPFHQNLTLLQKFKVSDDSVPEFKRSTVKEFKELNSVMMELTKRVQADYSSLKEFSENAAHEIQTPLAIIQNKLSDALQSPNLDKEMAEKIQSAMVGANRLSKLIQTLLLLAKIENSQFNKKENVELMTCIDNILLELSDFIEAKHISVELDLQSKRVNTDSALMDALFTNLIANAIKYNVDNGIIRLELKQQHFRIENISEQIVANPELMFDRFVKANPSSPSHGLGLAIVKKICDQQNWQLVYTVEDKMHILEIRF